jgi:hypothetical protein
MGRVDREWRVGPLNRWSVRNALPEGRPRLRCVAVRAALSRFQIVIALLVAMLTCGSGLSGIVHALNEVASHVCTCASGGDHASCPVCNPVLREHRASSVPALKRAPCGAQGVAVASAGDAGTLPAAPVEMASPFVWLAAPSFQRLILQDVILESTTPPPRIART